jgi:predicted nucleic acid-binding protein
MKVYLDTTVLIAFLFGELSDVELERHEFAADLFEVTNTIEITAFISLYALQELVVFAYANYPSPNAGAVLRLAMLTLFQNKVTLLPLLNRVETLRYRRRLDIHDRSDQPHAALALKNECDHILTYDAHFARVSAVTAMRPEEFLESVRH